MKDITIICGKEDEAVILAANDLANYLRKVCPDLNIVLRSNCVLNNEERNKDLVLIGNEFTNHLIKDFKIDANRFDTLNDEEGAFSIKSFQNPYDRERVIVCLEGKDKVGVQYACYDFAERVLGVRYLSPYFEYIPKKESITIPELNINEKPDFKYRGIWIWHYGFVNGRNGNWNDLFSEVWKNRNSDAAMLKRITDWAIKNKQNFLNWLGDIGPRVHEPVPQEHQAYEVMRGIKTIAVINPCSSADDASKPIAEDKNNYCTHDPNYKGYDPDHLCIRTERFWKVTDEYIDNLDFSNGNIIGVMVYFGESRCSGDSYDYGCKRCGDYPNSQKWLDLINYIKKRLDEKNIYISVGLLRTPEWLTKDGDREFAHKVVRGLPSDAICSLHPGMDHRIDELGGWMEEIQERNNRDGTEIKLWVQSENLFMCSSTDIPIVSPYYFETREYNFKKLVNDHLTIAHDFNLPTTKCLEWLKAYYTMKNQYKYIPDWRKFLNKELSHVFGKESGNLILESLNKILCVEKLEKRPDDQDGNKIDFPVEGAFIYKPEYARALKVGITGMYYMTNIFLDLKLTENIDNDHEFETNLSRIEDNMNHYLGLIEEAYDSIKKALAYRKKNQNNLEFFKKEIYNPIEWSCYFLKYRIMVVQSYCQSIRAKKAALNNDKDQVISDIGEAMELMNRAINSLEGYNTLMPYHGWDLAQNPPIEFLTDMADKLKDILNKENIIEKMKDFSLFDFKTISAVTWQKPRFNVD